MNAIQRAIVTVVMLAAGLAARHLWAVDMTDGLMHAVPVPAGTHVTIDGNLKEWDRSAAEPIYLVPQTVAQLNAEWSIMYDDDALYVGIIGSLPNRPMRNEAEPQDGFWWGDLAQIRLATDPKLPYPLIIERDKKSERVRHISFWKNTATGEDFIHVGSGIELNLGQAVNPPGSKIVITTDNKTHYTIEARLPWTALGAPDGKTPFKAGERMTAVIESLWNGGEARTAAVYSSNPGMFAFSQPGKWGQIQFEAKGFDHPLRPTMAAVISDVAAQIANHAIPGKEFTIDIPADGLKVSVNIFGPHGEVIREIIGGEPHGKGPLTLRWDGRDQWGRGVQPGSYRWGAYFHSGLTAQYVGSVSSSGDPTYPTLDGKGGWGADHSNPIAVATDKSGWYFLWSVGEGGKPLIKTDFSGKVIWRKNPFVGGGFGPFFAVASDEKHVYLLLGDKIVRLVRLDAMTGQLLTWNEKGMTELPIYEAAQLSRVRDADHPFVQDMQPEPPAPPVTDGRSKHPDAVGLSVFGDELFVSSFSENKVRVLNKNTGAVVRMIDVPGARGSAVNHAGDLVVASYVPGTPGKVLRIRAGTTSPDVVVGGNLEAPYAVSVGGDGRLFVSDLGASQQVKAFSVDGKLVSAWGRKGGRPWQGKYSNDAFLHPAGLATDDKGGLLVVEAAIPKVISRLDAGNGKVTQQFFGPGSYWNSTWAMPTDPTTVFSSTTNGLLLGKPALPGEIWSPLAYFAPNHQFPSIVVDIESFMPQPETIKADNGRIYLMREADPRAIFLYDDASSTLRPIAAFTAARNPYIDVWIDSNGDGREQDNEKHRITQLANGQPLPDRFAGQTGATHIANNGDLYFLTQHNSVLKLPAIGFAADGSIQWDLKGAIIAIPHVLPRPGNDDFGAGWRTGMLGVRNDHDGNLYLCFNARLNGEQESFDYISKDLAKRMCEGMGHTSTFNAVKFAKYDPQGNLIWLAGRKATSGAQPGEMYHFWNLAGLINDKYIAGASEWGRIYLYTADGFYVDGIMNDPGDSPGPGPYTFGGETAGGRVGYFADRGELWAYSSGMAYRVEGFKNGQVVNESRAWGQMSLDRVYDLDDHGPAQQMPLQIVKVNGNPLDTNGAWTNVLASSLSSNGKPLAEVKLSYDDKFLYGRIRVIHPTPLQNDTDEVTMAFKGGDSVAIVLGPDGTHDVPVAGDVRFIVARIKGQPKLIVMRPVAPGGKGRPFEYTTPAAGTVKFDDVSEVIGGIVRVDESSDGYTASFAIPSQAIGLSLKTGSKLRGDIEVRLSGAGSRGLQTTSRNYLFAPATAETTMVDDVPTESRLFPKFFGPVEVK